MDQSLEQDLEGCNVQTVQESCQKSVQIHLAGVVQVVTWRGLPRSVEIYLTNLKWS